MSPSGSRLFIARNALTQAHVGPDPDAPAQRALQPGEVRLAVEKPKVLAVIDAVGLAFKEGFTDAISLVYRLAAVLAVIAFLLTLKIPQLALRGRAAPVAPAE